MIARKLRLAEMYLTLFPFPSVVPRALRDIDLIGLVLLTSGLLLVAAVVWG